MGPVLSPHAHTSRAQDTRIAEPRLPAPQDGRLGQGRRLTPDAPHNNRGPPPPGPALHLPRGRQPPQGMQAKGTVLGPNTRTPAPTERGRGTPTARPEGGQPGEGKRLNSDTPHNGEKHPPQGCPSATPMARINGSQGVGPVLGPHANTDRTQDTRVAEPRPPVPEDGGQGEGQRLTPDAPRNGGRPTPPGTAPTNPATRSPTRGMRAKGTVLGPDTRTPAPTARG